MRLKGPFRKIFGMSKRDHGQRADSDGLSYDVTFVHQNHVNLCGDASAQMLLLLRHRCRPTAPMRSPCSSVWPSTGWRSSAAMGAM